MAEITTNSDFFVKVLKVLRILVCWTDPIFQEVTPPKTNGWIPKMMGLGKGNPLKKWQFWVSMLDFWGVQQTCIFWGLKKNRRLGVVCVFGSALGQRGYPLTSATKHRVTKTSP